MKIKVYSLLTLLAVNSAFAETSTNVDSISAVHTKSNGEVYVYMTNGDTAQGASYSCGTAYPYTYEANTSQGKALHSSILAAFMSGTSSKVHINGCLSGKPVVSRVNLYK